MSKGGPGGLDNASRRRTLTASSGRPLLDREPLRRPVGRDDLADQLVVRDRAPAPRVARRAAVVAHHEVVARRDLLRPVRVGVAPLWLDVRLVELLAVDVD